MGLQTMPLGKYKGQPLSTIPLDYIEWMLKQDWVRSYLRKSLDAEAQRRLVSGKHQNNIHEPPEPMQRWVAPALPKKDLPEPCRLVQECRFCEEDFVPGPNHVGFIDVCLRCGTSDVPWHDETKKASA